VFAAKAVGMQHEHHAGSTINQGLVTTASNCVSTGEVCLNHCHEMLAGGDKSFAACARSVNELIAACAALRSLAAQNSPFVPKYAKLTAEVCKSCEAECRKFEKNHAECKICADACAACIAECVKVA
jgi:Cys-rich four helix bundle protein (predicted Tat secretion target)